MKTTKEKPFVNHYLVNDVAFVRNIPRNHRFSKNLLIIVSTNLGKGVIIVGHDLGHSGSLEPGVPVNLGDFGLLGEVFQEELLELVGVDGLELVVVVILPQERLEHS